MSVPISRNLATPVEVGNAPQIDDEDCFSLFCASFLCCLLYCKHKAEVTF